MKFFHCLYDGNAVFSYYFIDDKSNHRKDKPRLLNGANFVKSGKEKTNKIANATLSNIDLTTTLCFVQIFYYFNEGEFLTITKLKIKKIEEARKLYSISQLHLSIQEQKLHSSEGAGISSSKTFTAFLKIFSAFLILTLILTISVLKQT